ncbi:lysM domain receptor-like kinase 3 isoform X4 [Rhododendron vialii]|uniref:lysM domain receptor-like kinase 3 isoform X4 n=1 Tax=Rhododendron vialii TaxID=182163 RepID=UPI00265FD4B6|nr:lysM domain receptor-like kinase 3 isoform X4 [Rhododendron vialii]
MIYLYTFPGNEPLPWSTRVQIALDWARGLEYMHEHTVPVYIHRDIKSAYILIDKNFHGKVADFGLAKLTEVGVSLPTCLVGTFGYMPPELPNIYHLLEVIIINAILLQGQLLNFKLW